MPDTSGFAFIAGSPIFCFVDTFGDRDGEGFERLNAPQDLADWFTAAGLQTNEPSPTTKSDLADARALREAIYRCGLAAIAMAPPSTRDISLINKAAARPPPRPQFRRGRLAHDAAHATEAALSLLAADFLNVLGSPARERIRLCPDCGMMFLDTSRPGRRRWCSSASGCGNRAKVRRLRERNAKAASPRRTG